MASAATAAAPLSPEIRLAQAVSEFVKVLSEEQKRSFRTQQENFTPPRNSDAMTVVAEIDIIAAHKQKGSSRTFGPRLKGFLQAVQVFASLGADVLGATLSSLSGSIWLIVRLTFKMLAENPRQQDKYSEIFTRTGHSALRFMKVFIPYPLSEQLKSSFSEYFVIIVRTCHCLVKSLQRAKPLQMSVLANVTSFSTDSTLRGYESELQKWELEIERELDFQFQSEFTESLAGITVSSEPGSRPKNPASGHDHKLTETYLRYLTAWKRIRRSGNTIMFTLEPMYQRFLDSTGSSTLLYSGVAGAGKSVVLANMVEDLIERQSTNAKTVFFFCCWDEPDSLQALTILDSLSHQALKDIPDGLLTPEGLPTAPSDTGEVATLLRSALEPATKIYIVLDGLDQCEESERAKVIEVLQGLQVRCSLSICLSSRPGVLSRVGWADLHSIDIPADNPDVSSYIDLEISPAL
ncbi:hypothetical protein FNYG_02787 [Fusarium nygamai]|uniref:NACHT domain-containing protein n=1 Tax=Gibberella nygamai TaxID=42673 RepID=A0A2K0WP95_GIBNY|nr:hypothetical protein FNYG_02787 [Fusarium nygamai]